MTEPPAAPPAPSALDDHLRDKLAGPLPLTVADLKKKSPRSPTPKGGPKPDLDAIVRTLLAEAVRNGRAFAQPSGKAGAERYWFRDEREAVRQAVLTAAVVPRTVAELKKAGAAGLKPDPGFVDGVVRGLIGEDRLFGHPAKTKAGGPRFATVAPPPPLPVLATKKFAGDLTRLATAFVKLQTKSGASADDLFAAVRERLVPAAATADSPPPPPAELDDLILAAVGAAGPGLSRSLAGLRQELPAAYRGAAFDAAVLRLAAARRVQVDQDSEPSHYPPDVRAGFVRDEHGNVYTNVASRGA